MQTTIAHDHQYRFGPLLKRWRSARKMSQLDLAINAGVSQRHVSFLESGRAQPSKPMVMQLSEALEVPLRERNSLLQAAGFAPYYRRRGFDEDGMAPVREALTRTLQHHDPYPGVVIDRDYNVLMKNAAFDRMTALFGDPEALWQRVCPNGTPNLLRLTFHPQGARPFIRNFDEVGAYMLQRAWRESQQYDGETRAFIEELRQDPSLPDNWHDPDPSAAMPPVLSLVLGQGEIEMRLFTMISVFGTPHDITTDEIRIETFFPGDAATEQLFSQLQQHN